MSRAAARRPVRVLYVQYTNPAMYPPLLHSTAILAEAGCDVHVLGLDTMSAELGRGAGSGVHVTLVPAAGPGWRQKARYGRFAWQAAREAARLEPDWLYASDALAAPIAGLARAGGRARLVYHEHDTPFEACAPDRASVFMRQVLRARSRLVRTADLCVVPNAQRARALERATGRHEMTVVWNCPRRSEAARPRERRDDGCVRFLYHGSLVPARLPLSVIDALGSIDPRAHLVLAGYETVGHPGYLTALLERASAIGAGDRVRYAGVLGRSALLDLAATCDVGVSLFPLDTDDPNESTMVGASNKAFEYLSQGVPLVVADRPEWREVFVGGRLARACDPASAASVAAALAWYVDHPAERCAMGERGRQRVLAEWNYETEFAPVLNALVS